MEQIYLKDYICDAEIGVFESEHGLKQRLKFDVTLDVDYEDVIAFIIDTRIQQSHNEFKKGAESGSSFVLSF